MKERNAYLTAHELNWRDNPWFPDVLDEERRLDLEFYPERLGVDSLLRFLRESLGIVPHG